MKGLSPISDWVEVRLLPREFPGSLNVWVLSSGNGDTEEGVSGNSYIPVPVYDVARCGRGAGGGKDVAEANWPLDDAL